MCVRMVYTLKTNRRPIATAREMDVGLDEAGEGREGMERRRDDGGRERERVVQSERVKVVIKRQ